MGVQKWFDYIWLLNMVPIVSQCLCWLPCYVSWWVHTDSRHWPLTKCDDSALQADSPNTREGWINQEGTSPARLVLIWLPKIRWWWIFILDTAPFSSTHKNRSTPKSGRRDFTHRKAGNSRESNWDGSSSAAESCTNRDCVHHIHIISQVAG